MLKHQSHLTLLHLFCIFLNRLKDNLHHLQLSFKRPEKISKVKGVLTDVGVITPIVG